MSDERPGERPWDAPEPNEAAGDELEGEATEREALRRFLWFQRYVEDQSDNLEIDESEPPRFTVESEFYADVDGRRGQRHREPRGHAAFPTREDTAAQAEDDPQASATATDIDAVDDIDIVEGDTFEDIDGHEDEGFDGIDEVDEVDELDELIAYEDSDEDVEDPEPADIPYETEDPAEAEDEPDAYDDDLDADEALVDVDADRLARLQARLDHLRPPPRWRRRLIVGGFLVLILVAAALLLIRRFWSPQVAPPETDAAKIERDYDEAVLQRDGLAANVLYLRARGLDADLLVRLERSAQEAVDQLLTRFRNEELSYHAATYELARLATFMALWPESLRSPGEALSTIGSGTVGEARSLLGEAYERLDQIHLAHGAQARAEALLEAGDLAAAMAVYAQLPSDGPEAAALRAAREEMTTHYINDAIERSQRRQADGDLVAARRILTEALDLVPGNSRLQSSLEALPEATASTTQLVERIDELARGDVEAGRYELALALFDELARALEAREEAPELLEAERTRAAGLREARLSDALAAIERESQRLAEAGRLYAAWQEMQRATTLAPQDGRLAKLVEDYAQRLRLSLAERVDETTAFGFGLTRGAAHRPTGLSSAASPCATPSPRLPQHPDPAWETSRLEGRVALARQRVALSARRHLPGGDGDDARLSPALRRSGPRRSEATQVLWESEVLHSGRSSVELALDYDPDRPLLLNLELANNENGPFAPAEGGAVVLAADYVLVADDLDARRAARGSLLEARAAAQAARTEQLEAAGRQTIYELRRAQLVLPDWFIDSGLDEEAEDITGTVRSRVYRLTPSSPLSFVRAGLHVETEFWLQALAEGQGPVRVWIGNETGEGQYSPSLSAETPAASLAVPLVGGLHDLLIELRGLDGRPLPREAATVLIRGEVYRDDSGQGAGDAGIGGAP